MPKPQQKDLYAILGVARDADADTIKKGYRKLAQKYHPDRNPDDPTAEERFKEVSVAHAVLSDPDRRRSYDEFGDVALDPNFDAEKARAASQAFGDAFGGPGQGPGFSMGGFEEGGGFGHIFEEMFGTGRGRRGTPFPQQGSDLETELTLDFADAVRGCEKRVDVGRPDADGRIQRETLNIRIPPGVEDGARIRLSGKGAPGQGGGPPGDLYAKVRVSKHAVFQRSGRDLSIDIPISIAEAITGAAVEIGTLDGRVTLKVPPGTDGGSRLRLRGKGVPAHGARPAGDLYVTVRIRVPKKLSEEQKALIEEVFDEDAASWRADLEK